MKQPRPCDGPHDGSLLSLITFDPRRRSGWSCVRDLRFGVSDVLDWTAPGMTVAELVADHPELTPADIQACLAYEAERKIC